MFLFQVIKEGSGSLIVSRRPNKRTPAWKYIPCSICLAFCHKNSMYIHVKNCPLKGDRKAPSATSFQDGLMLLESHLPQFDQLSSRIESIFQGMRETHKNEGTSIDLIVS